MHQSRSIFGKHLLYLPALGEAQTQCVFQDQQSCAVRDCAEPSQPLPLLLSFASCTASSALRL